MNAGQPSFLEISPSSFRDKEGKSYLPASETGGRKKGRMNEPKDFWLFSVRRDVHHASRNNARKEGRGGTKFVRTRGGGWNNRSDTRSPKEGARLVPPAFWNEGRFG
mmetsp:Transcript_3485/g.8226  ORF Transcript_3485/g.8226 Transcript_3485/m.8226 type:complete len:107 (+) Transcript_3485:1232-1552(+)